MTTSDFYLTAEVRLFIIGALPIEVKEYIAADALATEETRTDDYLVFPNATSVGVKFREGRFEVKSFVKSGPSCVLLNDIEVEIELWEKLSISSPADSSLSKKPYSIAVNKNRVKQTHSLQDGHWRAISAEERVDKGCQTEVTQVSINNTDQPYWTFSLEAFAADNNPVVVLQHRIAALQEDEEFNKLKPFFDNVRVQSYPGWLCDLSKKER